MSVKYTGYFVEIDGKNYGIFFSGSGFATIPYNSTLAGGLIDFPTTAGETTLWDDTLENAANCFLTGTHIATTEGARRIETLEPGDRVLTADGTATPVLWVWRQEVTNIFGLGEARMPIRVSTDALGPGCPARDLILTADHALVVDGFLINAGALVNGTTIAPIPAWRGLPARFHSLLGMVETEAHSVASWPRNCPSGKLHRLHAGRAGFDNFTRSYVAQGGDRRRHHRSCRCRCISTPRLLLPALRQRLGLGARPDRGFYQYGRFPPYPAPLHRGRHPRRRPLIHGRTAMAGEVPDSYRRGHGAGEGKGAARQARR